MLDWAGQVYIMETRHRNIGKSINSNYNPKIVELGILDRYKYYESSLIELLESKIDLS